MKAKELGHVIIRMVGIFCLVRAVILLSWFIGYSVQIYGIWFVDHMALLSSILSFLIPMIALLYCAYLCMKKTEMVGSIIGLDELHDSQEVIRVQEALTVVIAILGLVLVVLAIPKFMGLGTYALYYRYLEQNSPELVDRMVRVGSAESLGLMVKLPVQLLLGLYLFFRPSKVVDLWQRSQNKQREISEDMENEEEYADQQ